MTAQRSRVSAKEAVSIIEHWSAKLSPESGQTLKRVFREVKPALDNKKTPDLQPLFDAINTTIFAGKLTDVDCKWASNANLPQDKVIWGFTDKKDTQTGRITIYMLPEWHRNIFHRWGPSYTMSVVANLIHECSHAYLFKLCGFFKCGGLHCQGLHCYGDSLSGHSKWWEKICDIAERSWNELGKSANFEAVPSTTEFSVCEELREARLLGKENTASIYHCFEDPQADKPEMPGATHRILKSGSPQPGKCASPQSTRKRSKTF